MGFLETIILGIIQGLTEFLPVSSSGHLAIAQNLLNVSGPTFTFDLLLHLATQLVVILFFGKRIPTLAKSLFKSPKTAVSVLLPLILVTLPVVVVGLLFKDVIEGLFTSMGFIALFYIITAGLLFSTKFLKQWRLTGRWEGMKWYKALGIGFFQAISTLPGISRSGTTIIGGMYMGLIPSEAFEFSFLAGLVSVTGASVVEFLTSDGAITLGITEIVGAAIAAIVGYFVLAFVAKLIKTGKLWYFGFYCLCVAVLAAYLWLR